MTGYTTMTIEENGDLTFALTEKGREELAYQRKEYETKGDEAIFLDMIEDHLGYEFVVLQPEEVGALTSSLIIGRNIDRDDDQNVVDGDGMYWFPNYQVRAYTDALMSEKGITFMEASEA